uniref:THAP domain containing 9 n=1 Tax=Crocodylus porosus TaxID=8502 RepID=A0A7M4F4A2_CROPO
MERAPTALTWPLHRSYRCTYMCTRSCICESPSTRPRNRTSKKALKQPLLTHVPDKEAITEDHNYSLKGVTAAEQQTEMKEILQSPTRKCLATQRCLPHQKGNVINVISELTEKQLLSEEAANLLKAQFSDLPWGLPSWRQMAKYSAEMRQFACTLHIYSSKAYDYLRKTFPLPHPSSLTTWLSSDDANPGFSNSIFSRLQEKVEKGEQAYQYCSLLVDGLALRKQLDWDPRIQHLTGFMDLGVGVLDADEAPQASEAIVLMAVGVLGRWTAPVGYFFVNGATGHMLAQLLHQAINKLSNIGIVVLSVTSAASAHGMETAKALGVRMDVDNMRCTFQHPHSSTHQIAYFFDTCHLLQLIRNAFQCFHRIEHTCETAHWQHIVDLAALQEKRLLRTSSSCLLGSLTNRESCYLKVNYAAQLFSDGVASALQWLQLSGLSSFQNCKGTIRLVRLVSSLSDIFHVRSPYGKGLKGPLSPKNYAKINCLLTEAKSIFVTLTDATGRCVLKSKRKLGFLGFLLNAESLKWLYVNYILPESTAFCCLLTHAFSLDHLEQFLGTLKQACAGSNPTCTMFQAAYRQLLTRDSLRRGSQENNLVGDTSTLDASLLRRKNLTLHKTLSQLNLGRTESTSMDYMYSAGLVSLYSPLSNVLLDLSLYEESITGTAGFVAEKLAALKKCEACFASLFELDHEILNCGSLLCIKKIGGLSLPSESMRQIVSTAEQVLRTHVRMEESSLNPKQRDLYLEQKILHELSGHTPFFPSLTDHLWDGELHVVNHYTVLLREIIQCYLHIKAELAKTWGLEYCSGRHGLKRLPKRVSCSSSLKTYKSIQILPVP